PAFLPDGFDLAFEVGVKVDSLVIEIAKYRIVVESRRDLISSIRILAHDEEQRFLIALAPFVLALPPTLEPKTQVCLETVGGVVMGLLDQLLRAAEDRRLHNAGVNGLAKWRVAHDVRKNLAAVVFWGSREVELRDDAITSPFFHDIVQRADCLIPR